MNLLLSDLAIGAEYVSVALTRAKAIAVVMIVIVFAFLFFFSGVCSVLVPAAELEPFYMLWLLLPTRALSLLGWACCHCSGVGAGVVPELKVKNM